MYYVLSETNFSSRIFLDKISVYLTTSIIRYIILLKLVFYTNQSINLRSCLVLIWLLFNVKWAMSWVLFMTGTDKTNFVLFCIVFVFVFVFVFFYFYFGFGFLFRWQRNDQETFKKYSSAASCTKMYEGCIWFDLIWFDTFSNISAISWRPVLVVEEAGVPGENHRIWASNW